MYSSDVQKTLFKLPRQATVYLIVDALDECPSTSTRPSPCDEVSVLVEELVDAQLPNLRICPTGRPEADIKIVLGPFSFRSVSLHDESGELEDIRNDIKSVATNLEDPRNRRWKAEDKQRCSH